MHITCEIPGKCDEESFECDADCQNGKCIIKVSGNKINDLENIDKEKSKLVSKREFGQFQINIIIEDTNIDINSGKIDSEDGLVMITYNLMAKSSKIKFNRKKNK